MRGVFGIDAQLVCLNLPTHERTAAAATLIRTGMAGRGVLLDLTAWSKKRGHPLPFGQRAEVSVRDLEMCAPATSPSDDSSLTQ